MTHHIAPVRDYILVWLGLIALTVLTTTVGYSDLGPFNIVVAITIAVIKMSMVIWIFMGVRYTSSLTKLFVVAGFFWFLILIVMTGQDYISRTWLARGHMW
jgi:cytochrome c oxidase subunit 4